MKIEDWLKHFENILESKNAISYTRTIEESQKITLDERLDYFAFHDWCEENQHKFLPIAKLLLNEIIWLDKINTTTSGDYFTFIIKKHSLLKEFMDINIVEFGFYNKYNCFTLYYKNNKKELLNLFKYLSKTIKLYKEFVNSIS